jgi:hypothetical protein
MGTFKPTSAVPIDPPGALEGSKSFILEENFQFAFINSPYRSPGSGAGARCEELEPGIIIFF